MFEILKKDNKTRARLGVLNTTHGKVRTPSYVIANTYHLWDKALRSKGKNIVHDLSGFKIPVMTDSGGFQVFSLAFGRDNKVGKILNKESVLDKPVRQN